MRPRVEARSGQGCGRPGSERFLTKSWVSSAPRRAEAGGVHAPTGAVSRNTREQRSVQGDFVPRLSPDDEIDRRQDRLVLRASIGHAYLAPIRPDGNSGPGAVLSASIIASPAARGVNAGIGAC